MAGALALEHLRTPACTLDARRAATAHATFDGGAAAPRRLLAPLRSNAAWTELLAECGIADADAGLDDLCPASEVAALVDFVREACRKRGRRRAGFRLDTVAATLVLAASFVGEVDADDRPAVDAYLLITSVELDVPRPSPPPRLFDQYRERLRAAGAMGSLIADFDFARTPLGAMERWPTELLAINALMLELPFQAALWVGPGRCLLYNDPYARMSASKHPGMLGVPGAESWAELWPTLGPMADRVEAGEAVVGHDQLLLFDRSDSTDPTRPRHFEETYFSFSWQRFGKVDGEFLGIMNISWEKGRERGDAR